jgi:hypothetical protein
MGTLVPRPSQLWTVGHLTHSVGFGLWVTGIAYGTATVVVVMVDPLWTTHMVSPRHLVVLGGPR